jgi:hypothetical protein
MPQPSKGGPALEPRNDRIPLQGNRIWDVRRNRRLQMTPRVFLKSGGMFFYKKIF